MTTPQTDVALLLSIISPGGTIKLERYVPGKPPGTKGGTRFRGATMHDSDLLYQCKAPRYFGESEIDAVLTKVCECGFGLEIPEE